MDDRAIARWRMHALGLTGQRQSSPAGVVGALLGVQAENHAQASWAVATRTTSPSLADFARQFDVGAFLRTHVLRPTWHYVLPDDIRWLLELTGPRIRRSLAQRQRELGVTDTDLARSRGVIGDALAAGPLPRRDLAARMAGHGLPAAGRELGLLLEDAEVGGLICSGPMSDTAHTIARLDHRAPQARRLDRDEAVAELVRRYFTGHGPATERDLSSWASMTLTDVRAGLAANRGHLDTFTHDARTYWFGQPPPEDHEGSPRAHLLQTLDEYHNGYQDSRHVLDAEGIVPRGRPASVGMVVVDTQVVGGMRRTVAVDRVVFHLRLFRPLRRDERAAVSEAAVRYGRFLDREPLVTGLGDR
ncbi:winged helix DNA-binding domain-containing protein [Egicoccus sp. AB-alg6-2]|uniref:winged helix DNA-binding domain-containing protein n=1 Tax=Egicoccus sp. AB-alg6-2 TaxID=3242692 RepID=UPI00359DE3CD